MGELKGSRVLITGGTGSFGNNVIVKLLEQDEIKEIIVFSRDEKKQFDMRNNFNNHKKIQFVIGDIRNRERVYQVVKGVDYIFHAAALKQVPTCEFFPYEAVQTNIVGANNILDAAEELNVKKVVVLSTDKAVYPINAMGMTKAVMEKLMLAKARENKGNTIFCGVRYGNVMCSRGSVIPLFINQIKEGKSLTMTSGDMTRYQLPLTQAIDLVLFALKEGQNGDILVRKSPATTVDTLADAMIEIFNHNKGKETLGIREGEKMHETLVTKEELLKAEEYDLYYRIKSLTAIDYEEFFSKGKDIYPKQDYTSANTKRLNKDETKELLLSLPEVREALR